MMQQGQIIEGRGGLYTVRGDADGIEYVLRAKKKFRRQHLTPLVGDRVDYTPGTGDEHGWLEEILPRTSSFIRPPVSNISLLVMVAAETPAPDWLLLDKLLLSAHRQGMRCVLAINKCDLGDTSARTAEADYAQADVTVLRVSAEEKTGLDELLACMHGETVCFAGQSGVGKSTLINALMGLELETGSISRIERGRHTTRHVRLIYGEDFRVMDTPGFSLLEMEELMDPVELAEWYPEFDHLRGKCRFQPCYHGGEPGCAVQAELSMGRISAARVARYRELLEMTRKAWKERYD